MPNASPALKAHLLRIASLTSPAKAAASRANGKLGGRPRKLPKPPTQSPPTN